MPASSKPPRKAAPSSTTCAVSDLALLKPLPEAVRHDIETFIGCVAGAVLVEDTRRQMADAGFTNVTLSPKPQSIEAHTTWEDPLSRKIVEALPPGLRRQTSSRGSIFRPRNHEPRNHEPVLAASVNQWFPHAVHVPPFRAACCMMTSIASGVPLPRWRASKKYVGPAVGVG